MESVINPPTAPKLNGYGNGNGDGYGNGNGNGYGDGYGYGYGDGDGNGYGNGYGYGDGDGYGNGDGNGYGYGNGDGYGYGDGYGNGDGYGYGYGNGDGDGDGDKAYWRQVLNQFALKLPTKQQERLAELEASGATLAFWRSNADGTPANGGRLKPVKAGDVHEETGPLSDECGGRQLHATLTPYKWNGERWWIVALIGEIREQSDKMWGLKREIIGECQ